jgi:hypothetical protein
MSDNFCYIPFREFYYDDVDGGKFSSCCIQKNYHKDSNISTIFKNIEWFNNTNELKEIREKFIDNQRPEQCKKCWDLEDNNDVSYREEWNNNYLNQPKTVSLEVMDIRLTNKCNLQCKMCWPGASDQIAKNILDAKIPGITIYSEEKTRSADQNLLDNLYDVIVNTPTLRKIKFAGGEPFIINEFVLLLEKIADAGCLDISIFVLSNITTITNRLLNVLKRFKNVEVSCSVDGIGRYIEYQRFPCKWSVIERNFETLYNETGITVTLTPCWSQLNLLGLADFLSWYQKFNQSHLTLNEVTYPSFLSWNLIPLEFRRPLIEQLKTVHIPNNFKNFVKRIEYEFREISDIEKENLSNHAKLWDYNNKISYTDFAPWGRKLIS